MTDPVNLVEIIGREPVSGLVSETDYAASRVAELEIIDGRLWITEACDSYFSVELNCSETQRLIDWLQKVRGELTDDTH